MRRGGTCVASDRGEQTRIRKGRSLLEREQGAAGMNPSLQDDAELATLKKRDKKIILGEPNVSLSRKLLSPDAATQPYCYLTTSYSQ